MGKRSKSSSIFFSFLSPVLLSSVLPCILLLSLSKSTTVHADDQEKLILSDLKAHWSGSSYFSSWDSSSPHCNWPGIQCIKGIVTEISLRNTNISQPFPPFICNLKNLTHLDLSNNSIPGSFPTPLYNCSHLHYIDLSDNYFDGKLPADIDRLSSMLTYLDLHDNGFTGNVPPSIGRLPSLQTLQLQSNLFDGSFPTEIGNLSMLEWLGLAYNPFSSQRIPAEFGNLRRLKYLWMTKTGIVGEIPESFQQLTEVEHLDLSWNDLNGSIPASIWSIKKLKIIYLFKNNLSGEIRGKIEALGLKEIDLSMNQLIGPIPEEFEKLSNLSILFMYYNRLSGEIPRGIGLLPNLVDIRLFGNHLTGVLPPELGKHSNLTNLEVCNNRLSGSLPQGLCTNRALRELVVFNNNLSGEIPASLADCYRMDDIQLYNNSFFGEFPHQIWSGLANLTLVRIQNNRFTGGLPEKLPPNLTRLEINDNMFSGKMPAAGLRLQVFKASNNMFSGEISAALDRLPKLEVLWLDGNQISGSIPVSISALKFLDVLNLSNNHLSGGIPAAMGSLPQLTMLDLSRNQLSGTIPLEIGNLKLNFLNLSGNQLSGEIPLQLQNQAYEESFLHNPDLCSSKPLVNVNICAHQTTSLNKSSQRLLILLLVLGGGLLLMISVMGMLMCRRRSDIDDLPPWKLTSFQNLDFTEQNILSGLTQANLIGSGGSGQVYRINLGNRSGTSVAVKKIWNTRKSDWKMEKAFEAEVKILSSIRHANIVKLLCCISNADSKLLVYEFMENGSLDQWLYGTRRTMSDPEHGGTLDWPKRLGIAIDAAQGLCYMHHHCSSPIIHRDVKSSNILLDSEFNAKIADFGLARMLFKAGEAETASAMAGTFGYIAPECAYSKSIDEKVDVYSFGVVLLELTTGRKAREGGEHEGLAGWAARYRMKNGRVIELIDGKLVEDEGHLDDIEAVINLGIECTRRNPAYRPSMKEVQQILMECDHISVRRRNIETDPLLLVKRWSLQKLSADVSDEDDSNYQMYAV